MKQSRRAERMEKRHARRSYAAPVMLTSLMDIFTVLVVFLLASTSTGAQVPITKAIRLPDTTALQQPAETLIIQLSKDAVIVQGVKVADSAQALASTTPDIPSLVQALAYRAQIASVTKGGVAIAQGQKVQILADQGLPFALIEKVMKSCAESVYTHMALAGLETGEKKS